MSTEQQRAYKREYYHKHREEILKKMREKNGKKTTKHTNDDTYLTWYAQLSEKLQTTTSPIIKRWLELTMQSIENYGKEISGQDNKTGRTV